MTCVKLVGNLEGVIGCDYIKSKNQLVFVESNSGRISSIVPGTSHSSQSYKILGQNYISPNDIVVASDGRYAYVTGSDGNLLRVDLENADRSHANIIISKLGQPHQMALDETKNQLYLVDWASSGNLTRIDLGSKTKTIMASGLQYPLGLLLTKDFRYAYVSEMTGIQSFGRLVRIDVSTGQKEFVLDGIIGQHYLTWADSNESGILITENNPQSRLLLIDLKSAPVKAKPLSTIPVKPSSVSIAFSNLILVCCSGEIDQIDLYEKYSDSSAPLLLGIGHVPSDHIIGGYADTTQNPVTGVPEKYFFSVKDSPFGGTLAIMFNHEKARQNAKYYSIKVDGTAQAGSWSDYKWDPVKNTFVLTTAMQKQGDMTKFYIRQASELWYNHWLGYFLNTYMLSNGLHTVSVDLFKEDGTIVGHNELKVMIDNQWPQVSIDQIIHDNNPVKTCEIVKSGSHVFTFRITSQDPEQHLLSWKLIAYWGNDKSKLVAQDDYGNHITTTKKWLGVASNQNIPAQPWDASVPNDGTSTHCAHTFRLAVWDRVIDGWNYLHYNEYNKSITIDVP
jgi:hypothetical protein